MQNFSSQNKDELIKNAVNKYAENYGISQSEISQILEKIPDIKAKAQAIKDEDIEKIKADIGSEKLHEIEKLLNIHRVM